MPGDISENIPRWMRESEFAAFLNLASSTLRAKARDGIFIKDGPWYDVQQSMVNYLAQLREQASRIGRSSADPALVAAKLAKEQATARKIELANEKMQGHLLDATEVERAWASILRDVRASVLAVPSRVGAALPHLSPADIARIEAETRKALEALALRSTGSPIPADSSGVPASEATQSAQNHETPAKAAPEARGGYRDDFEY